MRLGVTIDGPLRGRVEALHVCAERRLLCLMGKGKSGCAQEARPIPRERRARLKEAKRRLEETLESECQANAAYEAYRARGVDKNGRGLGRPPKPFQPPATPTGTINMTDPDSRMIGDARLHPGL
jgi:hypothetical protein